MPVLACTVCAGRGADRLHGGQRVRRGGRLAASSGQTPAHHGFNTAGTGFSLGNVAGLFTDWTVTYGQSTADESSPVVADGVVYIAGADGGVSAFAAGGCGMPSWPAL
jgi:hypothetical protein